jgi:uridine kinase
MFTIKVTYKGNVYTYPKDTTLLDISNNFKSEYKYDIIIATVDNKLTELNKKLEKDCEINFYDMSSVFGNRVYERGLIYLYIKAVKDILKSDVVIAHSIDRGIYTEVTIDKELTDEDVINIENQMKKLVNDKVPFERLSVSRLEAIDYFESNKQYDKASALKYISNNYINLYKFDNLYDYLYGEMPVDTSYLKNFKLYKVTSYGIVLMIPNVYADGKIMEYKHHEKLFLEFAKYHDWANRVNLDNIPDLNKIISTGDVKNLIYMSEIEQNARLMDTARLIGDNRDIKIVLMAGPSSSGKTTTSKKLGLYLRSMGLTPHAISIDDYFLDRDATPMDENGNPDFESVAAINTKLFNEHLTKLLNYEEVLLPEYNFLTGKAEFKKNRLKLGDKDILIIEGLHALNDELTSSIDNSRKYKIYISPLTSINLDNHNRISTTDNRLLRRMVRDHKYRGYDANMTLANWQSVRIGEEKYVFPYQDKADMVFNTSLAYELSVLRLYAEPLLFSISEDDPSYGESIRLLNLLRNVLPITSDSIPLDSIIREFIGDSYFIG